MLLRRCVLARGLGATVTRSLAAPFPRPSLLAVAARPFATAAPTPVLLQRGGGGGNVDASSASYPTAPRFEIYDIHEQPENGKLVRVQYQDRSVLVTLYPQLGPRKADPLDPTPQFDLSRRTLVRLRPSDVALLLAVLEGRLPRGVLASAAHELTFERTVDGTGYELKGLVRRFGGDPQPWNISLTKSHVVMFFRFLESSLVEGFGFRAHDQFLKNAEKAKQQKPAQQQQQQQRQ